MSKKNICIVTGSRADWGLLYPLACELVKRKDLFDLQIIAAALHLSGDHGMTCREIENDGFEINAKVEVPLANDTEIAIAKSVGTALTGFVGALNSLKPDLVFVLGDRFEIFSAATACFFLKIPVAHIHGGELTEGSLDDTLRHCISKISHLHFVSTETYRKRVIQMGENPSRVFNVGAMGLDNIRNTKLLSRAAFEKETGFKLGSKTAFIAFLSATGEDRIVCEKHFRNLLKVLDGLKDVAVIFTKPSPDMYSKIISDLIDDYVSKHSDSSQSFTSMGRFLYLSALSHIDIFAGNSSSGIIEVPFFKIPTINIGNRQKGRVKMPSVIDVDGSFESINDAFAKFFSGQFKERCKTLDSPYGDGTAAIKIVDIIREIEISSAAKSFFDINFDVKNS